MAEVLNLPRNRVSTSDSMVFEPFVARVTHQANEKRIKLATKADALVKANRAEVNRIDAEISEVVSELRRLRTVFRIRCDELRWQRPVPVWVTLAFALVAILGEFTLIYELLDYLGATGHPDPQKPLVAYFSDGGWQGLAVALGDYGNEKALYGAFISATMFFSAKVSGAWVRQRWTNRPESLPGWFIVVLNLMFMLFVAGFALAREAHVLHQGVSELQGFWPTFVAIQAFGYVGACAFSAWVSPPDPQAARLACRIDQLLAIRKELWGKRTGIHRKAAAIHAQASNECQAVLHNTLGLIASYRDANFSARPTGDVPPLFMRREVPPNVFEPLIMDVLADPPAGYLIDEAEDVLAAKIQ